MRRSHRGRSRRRDRALVAVTRAASYSRLWLLISAGLAVLGGRPGRRAALHGVAALVIASAVSNGPAKLLVRRRRPHSRSRPTLIRMPRSSSFPSGHSASAAAFATATCGELPGLAPVVVPLACAVAYSRVHTGVHYPSDVAAGVAIGVACGVIAGRLPPLPEQPPRRCARHGEPGPSGGCRGWASSAPISARGCERIWPRAS
jgi:membrane-associated phospholipid phosphatase